MVMSEGSYLSCCHKHSNLFHSLQPGSSGRSGSPQHGEQNPGDRSDTGQVRGRCNVYRSRRMAHRFPTNGTNSNCKYFM